MDTYEHVNDGWSAWLDDVKPDYSPQQAAHEALRDVEHVMRYGTLSVRDLSFLQDAMTVLRKVAND